MEIFKNDKIEKVFESSIFILVGLIFIVFSFLDQASFSYTLAGFSIILSIFYLFGYFWTIKENNKAYLTKGVFLGLIALAILVFNNLFMQVLFILAAIFILYHAIQHFSFTLDMKTINEHHWVVDLIYAIVLFLIGGTLLVLDAFEGFPFQYTLLIIGSVFILDSTTKILLFVKLHPSYNVRTPRD